MRSPSQMRTYFSLDEYQEVSPAPVLALGNFDGVHLGHQAIFEALRAEAQRTGGTDIVVTFFPHPLKVLCPPKAPPLITTIDERLRLIGACGNTVTVCIPFTLEFAQLTPEEFVKDILVGHFGVKRILVGEDTRFGKDRRGDVSFLRESGKRLGFSLQEIAPVLVHHRETSSTRIRECVRQARLDDAAAMLGRYFSITGKVVEGKRRGRQLGFPTANLATDAELLPPNGVYAVWALLGGTLRPGVANLGTNPTFSGQTFSLEVHLLDFDQNLYGERLRVAFVQRLREERRFPNVQALVAEIREDVRKTGEILSPGLRFPVEPGDPACHPVPTPPEDKR